MLIKLKFLERSGKRIFNKFAFWVPCLFTFLNGILGFYSILRAFDGDYNGASLCIIMAALADSIDGRLARALGATSYLGSELDSLCDAVSFCLAPSILLYSWFRSHGFVSSFQLTSLAFYMCAGIYRLAKFNIDGAMYHNYFKGLPTTVSALIIATICFYYNSNESFIAFHNYVSNGLFVLGYLMLSPLKFYSFKRSKILKQSFKNIWLLVGIVFFIGACVIFHNYPLSLLLLICYVLGNLMFHIISLVADKLR